MDVSACDVMGARPPSWSPLLLPGHLSLIPHHLQGNVQNNIPAVRVCVECNSRGHFPVSNVNISVRNNPYLMNSSASELVDIQVYVDVDRLAQYVNDEITSLYFFHSIFRANCLSRSCLSSGHSLHFNLSCYGDRGSEVKTSDQREVGQRCQS